jgi:hypothetical protein
MDSIIPKFLNPLIPQLLFDSLALWIGIGYCKRLERRFTIGNEERDSLLGPEDATWRTS